MGSQTRAALKPLAVASTFLALLATATACGSESSSTGSTAAPAAAASTSASDGGETSAVTPGVLAPMPLRDLKIGELTFDPTKYCGDKPAKVGIIDGFGGNAWRVQNRAMEEALLKKCPNVTEVKYSDANLDPEAYIGTLGSWAAQGVNVIAAYPDFGQATVPAFRAATQQGVFVGTPVSLPGNAKVPQDLASAVIPNFAQEGAEWVDFLDKAIDGPAKVALIGGPAGNSFDPIMLEAMNNAIKKTGADVEFVEPDPVVGNWEAAKTQQATAAMINKHPDINGLVMTYAAAIPSAIRAFEAAGKPLPAFVGQSSSNELVCEVQKLVSQRDKNPGFALLSHDGSGNIPPITLFKALAAYEGIDAPELGTTDDWTIVNMARYIDTLKGDVPKCYDDLPGGADMSMAMTPEEVAAAVGK
jgi:ribose transport system substrate-binding protein